MLAAMLAGMILTGCGAPANATSCGFTMSGPADSCEQALSAAGASLGVLHAPIVAVSAQSGAYFCGNGCTIPPDTWWVVYAFSAGDPVLVLVTWVGGTATASEPRPVPAGMPVPAPPQ